MKRRHVLVTGLLCAGAALGATASAQAEAASVGGIDGVLFEGCHYQPFDYAIDADKAGRNWSLEVTAHDPSGEQVASTWLWKTDGDAPSGRATGSGHGLHICDSAAAGTYRLTAQLHLYDAPATDETLPASTFTMREPESRTGLAVDDSSASLGQRLQFRVRSKVEQPKGFVATGPNRVALERRTLDGWVRIAAADTDEDGVAVRSIRWKHRMVRKVRAVTLGTSAAKPSYSRAVLIR